jgi:acyl-CoA reductase-like NAD-dependent aldehyde dehydrogenase
MSVEESLAGLGHLVNGKIVRGEATFTVHDPSTGKVVAYSPAASLGLLDEAVAAAKAAQPQWYAGGEERRRDVIRAMGAALVEHIAELNDLTALEKGIPMAAGEAYFAKVFADHLASTPIPVDVLEDTEDRTVRVVRKPVGVVAAISPWNAPILISAEKILAALLVGDTVVAKPSPFTPLATLKMGELWKDLTPPGVVNILAGGDDVGAAMVDHPDTDMISFTGSVAAGKNIAQAAGRHMKNTLLELGGNDVAIVLPDVDVPTVAARIFASAFSLTGQTCASVKRLYVHESIRPQMVDALADLARHTTAAPAADGGTMGPLITRPQYERVAALVEDARAHGATIAAGGAPGPGDGFYYQATIVTDIAPGVRLVDEEQFGPVLPVIGFTNVDDAITQANASDYGLAGSVWTADTAHGETLAARLECGTTWVNHHTEIAPHIPFGGTKNSGVGRSSGKPGIDAYSELQTQITYKSKDRVTAPPT